QRSAALQQYRSCVQVLDEELGVAPLEATTDLYEALRAKQLPPLPELANGHRPISTVVAPATAPKSAPYSLPERSHVPFVGRDIELDSLLGAWRQNAEAGSVMIVAGEAGIGKTRLAQEFLSQA